jgi:hypothetical protein
MIRTYSTGKKWSEGTKKYAISTPSAAIALRYGANVSRGIAGMEKKIEEQKKEIAQMGAWIDERV